MKRSRVGLEDVADWHTLTSAFHLAARGKPDRRDIRAFAANMEAELAALRQDILAETVWPGPMTAFRIRDPKPRIISGRASAIGCCALMAHVGPVLDRALVFDTYACRLGKGTLAAVCRCRQFARRFPWYGKIDVRAYFASIDHARLMALLRRRFKNHGVLDLMARIVEGHHDRPGIGLPIGALTSQHFANFYLAGLDRLLLEGCRVGGMVRYMDDVVWWCDSRAAARRALAAVRTFRRDNLLLEVKEPAQIGRSAAGLAFCGFRVLPGALLLSRRRRRRYSERRRHWERAFAAGEIDAPTLQAGFGSALAITAHADAAAWRREQLRRRPLAEALCVL